MLRLRLFAMTALFVAAALSTGAAQAGDAATPGLPAQYSAVAIGQAGVSAGKSFGLTIYMTGLTSDGDRDELIATLKSKGQDGLVSELEDMKDKGRVAPTGSVGTGMKVVRVRPTANGGQHITLATNRPISFPELYNGTRSTQYKIGIVTLDLDKDGKGTGTFAPLNKVRFNKKGELEIEYYGQKPFRLVNVNREK